jgi:O-succinylhomoserine sulfhydrylase
MSANRSTGGGVKTWRQQTRMVRGGLARSGFEETAEAIYMTSGYVYQSAEEAEAAFKGEVTRFVYSRYANPTVAMFEERLRLLEGAETCRGTASGMAAVFAALMCQLKAGDRVVSSRALFGSCHYIIAEILPRYGIETQLIDGRDLSAWEAALAGGARVIFLETPSNPTLEIIDLAAVCELAHKAGASVVVDNVFASPVLQQPLQLGADIVVYSATKHIDGQGRTMGGAVLGTQQFHDDHLNQFLRHTGPSMSPFNAWTLVKGLETLEMRMAQHCANAREIAEFLEARFRLGGQLRDRGRQGARLSLPQRAPTDRHLQQPRRRQEPDHPSGDDNPSTPEARGAGGARHRRRLDALVGGARGSGGSQGRPVSGICRLRQAVIERSRI